MLLKVTFANEDHAKLQLKMKSLINIFLFKYFILNISLLLSWFSRSKYVHLTYLVLAFWSFWRGANSKKYLRIPCNSWFFTQESKKVLFKSIAEVSVIQFYVGTYTVFVFLFIEFTSKSKDIITKVFWFILLSGRRVFTKLIIKNRRTSSINLLFNVFYKQKTLLSFFLCKIASVVIFT